MFSRLDKFDGLIFEGGVLTRRLIFGMLTGLHIWGAYIRRMGSIYTGGGLLTDFYSNFSDRLET